MCESHSHIRLCTCEFVLDASTPTWVLYRPSERGFTRIGKFMPKRESVIVLLCNLVFLVIALIPLVFGSFLRATSGWWKIKFPSLQAEKILKDLNSQDVFDFKYDPLSGDVLAIYIGRRTFVFEFCNADANCEWMGSSMDSQALEKRGMVIFDRGCVSN